MVTAVAPSPFYFATKGLLAYREKKVEESRKLYLEAIKYATSTNQAKIKVLAIWHLLREESKLGTLELERIVDRVSRKFAYFSETCPEN